jgi:hypothetical protein
MLGVGGRRRDLIERQGGKSIAVIPGAKAATKLDGNAKSIRLFLASVRRLGVSESCQATSSYMITSKPALSVSQKGETGAVNAIQTTEDEWLAEEMVIQERLHVA